MRTEFSAGRVVGRSLSLLFSNGGAFLLMAVLIHLPLVLFRIYMTTAAALPALKAREQGIIMLIGLVLQPLAAASVTYGVIRELSGKPAGFGDCITVGLARMFMVLLVGVVAGLITMLGLFAFCIPGILAWIIFFVATPASVVERLGVLDSLRRSEEMTRGARWPIFGVLAFNAALQVGVLGVLYLNFVDWHQNPPVAPTSRTFIVIQTAASIVLSAIQAITSAVAYNDLRRAREGGRASDFLSVFD
jgi:hypothetical protein